MEGKNEINQKVSKNSIYSKFHCAKLPTMSLVYKARSAWKRSHKNLLRNNSARSCHWEVFFEKDVHFLLQGVDSFLAPKINWKSCSSFQIFWSLIYENTFLSQMFLKTGVLKNFAIFTEKHPRWSLISIKLQSWRPTTLLKRGSDRGVFLWN